MSRGFNKKLSIRIVIATWGLAGFLLVNYYSSLCISFLTIPITKPLIQSIEELRKHPEIQLVIDKNRNAEAFLLVELVQSIISTFNIDFYFTVCGVWISERIG